MKEGPPFKSDEIAPILELPDPFACHRSIRNLIRRAMAFESRRGVVRSRPELRARIGPLRIVGTKTPATIESDAFPGGGFNITDNTGIVDFSAGGFDKAELPPELREALTTTSSSDIPNLIIFAIQYIPDSRTVPPISRVALGVEMPHFGTPEEAIRFLEETGEEEGPKLEANCNGREIKVIESIVGKKTEITGERGFLLSTQLIRFANQRLDAYLDQLRSTAVLKTVS